MSRAPKPTITRTHVALIILAGVLYVIAAALGDIAGRFRI